MSTVTRAILRVAPVLVAVGILWAMNKSARAIFAAGMRSSLNMHNPVWPESPDVPSSDEAWQWPAVFVGLVAVGFVVNRWRKRVDALDQAERDGEAERIEQILARKSDDRVDELLRNGNEEAFILYLRPFALEEQFVEKYGFVRSLEFSGLKRFGRRFDFGLVLALKKLNVPVICLGHREEDSGAGRIHTADSRWEEVFHLLAWRAKAIIAIPGSRAGLIEEFCWLRDSWQIGKTTFFKPRGYSLSDWVEATRAFAREGARLPQWQEHQISFRMHPNGNFFELKKWTFRLFAGVKTSQRQLRETVLFR